MSRVTNVSRYESKLTGVPLNFIRCYQNYLKVQNPLSLHPTQHRSARSDRDQIIK